MQIQVRDSNNNPISGINYRISLGDDSSDDAIYDNYTDLAGNSGWPIPYWPNVKFTLYFNFTNVNPYFKTAVVKVDNPHDDIIVVLESNKPVWPPEGREVLPSFPSITSSQPNNYYVSCWAAQPYYSDLPNNIPAQPNLVFHRGNFCGVRVPGLVEGDDSKDRSLDITWNWTLYSDSQMKLCADFHADVCGYTHTVLSIPQVKNQGKSLDDLKRVARYSKSKGFKNIIVAVSDGDLFEAAVPWLEELYAEGLIDIVCGCWQVDKYYNPMGTVQLIRDNGIWSHFKNLITTIHWGGGYPGWAESCACWDDDTNSTYGINDRYTFQAYAKDYLDGHYGQCDTESDIDQVQSWLKKALIAMPSPMFLVAAEMDAQAEYDDPKNRLELYGDMKGRLAISANPDGRISYLNGGRKENGQVI